MAETSAGDASSAVPMFGEVFTDINAHYILGRKLGTGNFAKVVQAQCKHDLPQYRLKAGQHVAVKVVKKPQSRSVERLHMIRAEVEILRSVQHANVVRLFEIFESDAKIFLVMEELTGGELFDRLVTLGKYTEEDARYFTFKLLNAVLYLHDRNICHRDLKPENILLANAEPDAELKITDFGLSKIAAPQLDDFLMTTRCGTPGYVAPEVLAQEVSHGQLRKYGTSCDMWSVGVIVYILLSAAPPFYGKTDAEMNKRIKQGTYKFPDKYWASISQPAKDFIGRLLTVDPNRRMSAAEALQHDWIVSIGLHTSDLFAMQMSMKGVPVMQARFGEFTASHRGEARSHQGVKDLLALPEDEEELHHFRCSHANRTGHLVLTPAHLAFLAYDQSTMFSLPIEAILTMRPARAMTWAAASDNSMVLQMSNKQTIQFDGFWERDECIQLLQACGRFLKHTITLPEEEVVPPAAAPAAETEAGASSSTAPAAEEAAATAEGATSKEPSASAPAPSVELS